MPGDGKSSRSERKVTKTLCAARRQVAGRGGQSCPSPRGRLCLVETCWLEMLPCHADMLYLRMLFSTD